MIAQFGGQTPLNLAADLERNGVKILGTAPSVIDLAEDRDLFREMMDKLEIPMPESGMAVTVDDALEIAEKIGYPVMVRPSYVLVGRGMEVVYDAESMVGYMKAAVGVTPDRPISIAYCMFIRPFTCISSAIFLVYSLIVFTFSSEIFLEGIIHAESPECTPASSICSITAGTNACVPSLIASASHSVACPRKRSIENGKVYVLEANPRASRTVPLVSKVCNIRMVPLAIDIVTSELTGRPSPVPALKEQNIPYYGVKEAVFPFNMFPEVDPLLGPEMRSTGEVLGLSKSFGEAFYKAQEATQTKLPLEGTVLISVSNRDKPEVVEVAADFAKAGFKIIASDHTCSLLKENGIEAEKINKLQEGRPNMLDVITNGKVDMIVNTPSGKESKNDDSYLRKAAIKKKVPYMTTMAAAKAAANGILAVKKHGSKEVKSLQEIHGEITDKE